MTETPIGTIETLLENLLEETDDPEIHFKLRTALQLLTVVDTQREQARQSLEDADIDDSVRDDLRKLGYLDA